MNGAPPAVRNKVLYCSNQKCANLHFPAFTANYITERSQAGDHCNQPEVETTSISCTSHKWLSHSLNNEAAWILHVTSSTLLYSKNNSSTSKHVKLNPHFITHTKWLPKDKIGNEQKKQTLILKALSIKKSQIDFKKYIPILKKKILT